MVIRAISSASFQISSSSSFLHSRLYAARNTPSRLRSSRLTYHILRASATDGADDCNVEECAPEKETGKLSMEWKAEEQTKVLGTYPPMGRPAPKWTGYVEKDTAGQTNIYAVEPTVYVSENVISSNTAGDSTSGSEQTVMVAIAVGLSVVLALGLVAQYGVGGGATTESFNGPALSYYIQKFKAEAPAVVINGDAPTIVQASTSSSSDELGVIPMPPTQPDTDGGIVVEAPVEPAPISTSPEAQ